MSISPRSSASLGETDICAHWFFCTKVDVQEFLFEAFTHIMYIFGSVEPQTESTFPFNYIIVFEANGQWRHNVFILWVALLLTLSERIWVSTSLAQPQHCHIAWQCYATYGAPNQGPACVFWLENIWTSRLFPRFSTEWFLSLSSAKEMIWWTPIHHWYAGQKRCQFFFHRRPLEFFKVGIALSCQTLF